MATRALEVLITADKSRFDREMRGIDQTVDRSEKRMSRFGKVGRAAFSGIGIAAGTAAALGIKQAATAAIEAEKSQARLETQLKASNISFKAHSRQIDEVIQKHSRLSGLDDEDLQDAFTNIVRITGDVDKSLRLTGLAADFARAKHMDVAKAGELVAKVAGGNTGILSRYGIQIEKGATATQALGELQQKFAGQAEAYGRTTAGSVDRASVAWENLMERLGNIVAPVIVKVTDLLTDLFDSSSKGNRVIRSVGEAYVKYLGWVRDAVQGAIRWVRRFADRNREDIAEVVETLRRLGRVARNVFEDVLAPVVRRVLPVVRGVADGIVSALRGMIRIVTGIVNGDWKRVWEGVKDIARGAVKAMQSIYRGLWRGLRDSIKALAPLAGRAAVTVGKAIGEGILAGAKSALTGGDKGGLGDQILDNIPGLGLARRVGRGIGDGVGKKILPPLPPGGPGGLMGADPDLAPFAGVGARFGLSVSSGFRPGSITSTGNKSFHASGDAIDLSGPAGGMMRTFRYLKKNFGSRLRELIYTPGGAGIKDGRPFTYTGQVAADHFDHVHVAYTGPFGDGLGRFASTAYGPPWNAMNGTGVTATGVDLRPAQKAYGVAVDPDVIPLGSKLRITPNPFGYGGTFTAFDTGGAIKGDRIDFYDWRGRKSQLAWGRRTVRVSTGSGGGGAPGAGGGGGGAANSGARGAFERAQKGARGTAREAVGSAREAAGEERAAARELPAARLAARRARAEARDDLPGLIKVMVDERSVARRRLRAVRKALKRRRLSKKGRVRLLNEEAELLGTIGDLTEGIKEYKADQRGGATTISQAEAMDAGVSADAGEGPTAMDFVNADIAKAALTSTLTDDIAAVRRWRDQARAEYNAALATPDPRDDIEAANNLKAAIDALDSLTKATEEANRLQQEQVENQRKILQLARQGPAILASVVAAVNGDIGGRTGLGFQSVGVAPGTVAAY